ncbi:integral membrane protein [Streptomyces sp. 769]|nr:integral membrane protein [Streptomyces sp. 769]
MSLTDHVVHLAYNPGVTPASGGLPGLAVLKNVVNSINLFGIIAVVGALAVSLGVWAWGHHTGGHQAESNGKKGAVVAAGAALGLGAANGIVAFFSALGSQVH